MHDTTHTQLTTYSIEQARAIWNAAWEAYQLHQFRQAAELYTRALEIGEAIDWTECMISCRAWSAISLRAAGNVRQALINLAPLLQMQAPTKSHAAYFQALMTYVNIARTIPTSLTSIEATYARITQFLDDNGHTAWRSNLLYSRSELFSVRNEPHEALKIAQESWACWNADVPGPIADVHLEGLISLSRQVRDRALAQQYMDAWQRLPDNRPLYRERALSTQQSWLARWDRRLDDALEWARQAMAAAERSDQATTFFAPNSALIYAHLSMGSVERARPILARIAHLRHAQNIHIRLVFHWVRGDFHLACARDAAGMPPVDDALDNDFPLPKRVAHQETVSNALQRARRAYAAALHEGCVIEEKLACSGYRAEVAERLERVAAIEQRLDTQRYL